MNRRSFIKTTGLATATLCVPQFIKATENTPLQKNTGKKLIVVQLTGGNDGLNTVIPYNDDAYYRARPTIAIKKNDALPLSDELGLNSALAGFKTQYDNGNMCLINNVGYPDPDRSHFRSMDIWQTASGSNEYISSGWLGRYLDVIATSNIHLTQLIEIDDTLSLALRGVYNNGLALKDPKKLFDVISDPFIKELGKLHPNTTHYHDNASYLYDTLASTISSAQYLYNTSKIYKSAASYPNHSFGKSMKTISELIISGVDTNIYYVSLGGFDTHFNQVKRQTTLLQQLSETINVFMNDMKTNGRAKDILLMTFSEFGRRVQENASEGTDHGTANQMFLFGEGLKKNGVYNDAPNLSDLDNGDLKYTTDFRSVYATILNKWLNTPAQQILHDDFPQLNFL